MRRTMDAADLDAADLDAADLPEETSAKRRLCTLPYSAA